MASASEAVASFVAEVTQREGALAQHRAEIDVLKEQVGVLLLASEVSPEIVEALAAIDRRQLSEVSKLGKPPETVKKALEVVCMFVDVFGGGAENRGAGDTSGGGGADVIAAKLAKKRPWDAIRAEMAVDLRKSLVGINPKFLAEDRNEVPLVALHKKFGSLDQKQITRASKPTGILFRWCKAVLECAVSIRKRKEVEASIEEMVSAF